MTGVASTAEARIRRNTREQPSDSYMPAGRTGSLQGRSGRLVSTDARCVRQEACSSPFDPLNVLGSTIIALTLQGKAALRLVQRWARQASAGVERTGTPASALEAVRAVYLAWPVGMYAGTICLGKVSRETVVAGFA